MIINGINALRYSWHEMGVKYVMNDIIVYRNSYLMHHGIKGQRWGIRRYQNEDGTLTEAGKKRYSSDISDSDKKYYKLKGDTPRNYQRSLNRLEKAYVDETARATSFNYRASKNMNKMLERAHKKGIDVTKNDQLNKDRRTAKYSRKTMDNLNRQLASQEKIKKMESERLKMVQAAIDKGYDVAVSRIPRETMSRGKNKAAFLLGPLGVLGYSAVLAAKGTPSYMTANKYEVNYSG